MMTDILLSWPSFFTNDLIYPTAAAVATAAVATAAVADEPFSDIRTRITRLPLWTQCHQLSRNPLQVFRTRLALLRHEVMWTGQLPGCWIAQRTNSLCGTAPIAETHKPKTEQLLRPQPLSCDSSVHCYSNIVYLIYSSHWFCCARPVVLNLPNAAIL